MNPDYIDPAIGLPVAACLFAYWLLLIWKDHRRG